MSLANRARSSLWKLACAVRRPACGRHRTSIADRQALQRWPRREWPMSRRWSPGWHHRGMRGRCHAGSRNADRARGRRDRRGGRNARDIDLTVGMSCLRKLDWSLASGDGCGPARLTRVCAAVIAGYDRCLAAAGGLEAVREATVHDIARTPGSSPGIGVRRQINAARDNSGPTPDDGVIWRA